MAVNTEVKIMVVDDDVRWAQGLEEAYHEAHVDFRPKAWLSGTRGTTLERVRPDVVLWDCTEPDADTIDLVHYLHELEPSLPMLLLVDFKRTSMLQQFADVAAIDLVRSPADIEEVVYRVRRLIRGISSRPAVRRTRKRQQETALAAPIPPAREQNPPNQSVFPHMALDLYNSESGRLDARKIGALFGIKLVDIARLLNQKLPTLSKTPDAPSIQSGLALFQRIGLALSRLVGSPEGLRIWMNAPNPQLEGKTPISVVLDGQGDVVAEMLEDMLIGQPA